MLPEPVVVPEVKVTFTTSFSRTNREVEPPRDVGELTGQGDGVWVLNPKSPLPLTVVGADRRIAEQLKALLGTAEYWSQKILDIALVIAQHNLRFRKLDGPGHRAAGLSDAHTHHHLRRRLLPLDRLHVELLRLAFERALVDQGPGVVKGGQCLCVLERRSTTRLKLSAALRSLPCIG